MHIPNVDRAKRYLTTAGYYHLSGYWYPMRSSGVVNGQRVVLDSFLPLVSFDHVVAMFQFDKELRTLLLEAITRIEQALKVDLAHHLGKEDTFAHLHARHFSPGFVNPQPKLLKNGATRTPVSHADWIISHNKKLTRPNEFVKHHQRKYGPELPIWVAIEVMDFGDVLYLIDGLRQKWRAPMAVRFGLPDESRFSSWLGALRSLRNLCAHHGRVWNHASPAIPATVSLKELPQFSSLHGPPSLWNKPYATFMIVAYLNKQVVPASRWQQRFAAALATIPAAPGIDIKYAGAPANWATDPTWL